jgi:hypothetical protein
VRLAQALRSVGCSEKARRSNRAFAFYWYLQELRGSANRERISM